MKTTERPSIRRKLSRYPWYLRLQFQRRLLVLLRMVRSRYTKRRKVSSPNDHDSDEQTPKNPKLKVHRTEKNRHDRRHDGVAPREEMVEATRAAEDFDLSELESASGAKPLTRRSKKLKRAKRKSAVYAARVRQQLPRVSWSTLRPRKPSKERVWILATLTGAAAVFLLMVLQMAESKRARDKQNGVVEEQTTDDPIVVSPNPDPELSEAELNERRLAHIDDMSQPETKTAEETQELTFLEKMDKLRKRPFLRSDEHEPRQENSQAATTPDEPLFAPDEPKTKPETADAQSPADPVATIPVLEEPKVEIAVTAEPPVVAPELPKEPEVPNEEVKVEAPVAATPKAPAKEDDPFGPEPEKKPEAPIAKTEETPFNPEPAPTLKEPVRPEPPAIVSTPAPQEKPEPEKQEPVREPERAPEIVKTPPDADLSLEVDRLPIVRNSEPEDPANQFVVVRSDTAAKTELPLPSTDTGSAEGAWSQSKPDTKESLANPNFLLERKPTWRLVAPLAETGNPEDIRSADSTQKELNIVVTKTTPHESAVKQMLSYDIIVRNNSAQSVDGLIIEEHVPESLQVADVTPKASFENQTLKWLLNAIGPREERKLEVNLFAVNDGPAKSVTIARPFAAVATETQVDPSQLRLEIDSAPQIASGRLCPLVFRVTNLSTSPVEGVVLHAELPEGLTHAKGNSLDLAIEKLEPGETHTARLNPRAVQSGTAVTPASVLIGENHVAAANASVRIVNSSSRTSTRSRHKNWSPCPCECLPCCP